MNEAIQFVETYRYWIKELYSETMVYYVFLIEAL
jgi:hypothetical protein